MLRALAFILAVTLAAAFPAAAQAAGTGEPCGTESGASWTDCCSGTPRAADCPVSDCAGAGAALPVAGADRGCAALITDSPETLLARLIAPLARAPDTAPPKPVV
jgi:hypothetical protein